MVSTSLSPRPDRPTITRLLRFSREAFRARYAMAWAGSSAGIIPSVRQQLAGVQRLAVRHRHIARPADALVVGMLGADAWIIQSGRDRMSRQHLAVAILQEQTARPVQDA